MIYNVHCSSCGAPVAATFHLPAGWIVCASCMKAHIRIANTLQVPEWPDATQWEEEFYKQCRETVPIRSAIWNGCWAFHGDMKKLTCNSTNDLTLDWEPDTMTDVEVSSGN